MQSILVTWAISLEDYTYVAFQEDQQALCWWTILLVVTSVDSDYLHAEYDDTLTKFCGGLEVCWL